MTSRHHGDPEVELRFEADDEVWNLEKRFAGASKGSARLTGGDGTVSKMMRLKNSSKSLLQMPSGGKRRTAKELPTLWSHLWVWQGSAGDDPANEATAQKDTLVQRLQHEGVAAVMQSEADQRARDRIASAYEEFFTATGKPRSGSAPELARVELAAAEEAVQDARDSAARLEEAAASSRESRADHRRNRCHPTGTARAAGRGRSEAQSK